MDLLARSETVEPESSRVSTGNNVQALRPGDVIISDRLAERPAKPTDVGAMAEALAEIAPCLVPDPGAAGRAILAAVLRLCGCGSAGLSLVEADSDALVWSRVAGLLADQAGLRLPPDPDAGRCCIAAGATILVSRPFAGLADDARAPLLEGLLTPLRDGTGQALGVLWAVHHDVTARFDAEDARILEQFAGLLVLALKAPDDPRSSPMAKSVRTARPSARAEAAENPFIRKLHGFVPLSAADREHLHRLTENAVPVPARTDLIREGDRPGGVFLMMEGVACRYRRIGAARRQVTAFLLPGDFCDLDVALLSRMDHTIMTLTEGRVARLDRSTILDLTGNHPNIAAALRKTTLVDEATLREWLVGLGSRTPIERIAHLFCELQARFEVVGLAGPQGFPLPLSLSDLADATGLSGVHVTRAIRDLSGRGFVAQAAGMLVIRDPGGLKALAGFGGDYLHLEDRHPRG
ncbi:helix-turn-helix domain-containing protein [Methylobacterium sp. M6A4_1b]